MVRNGVQSAKTVYLLCAHPVPAFGTTPGNTVIWGEITVEFFHRVLFCLSEGSTLLQMAGTSDSDSIGMMNYLCNK